jgi:hypothetical protein
MYAGTSPVALAPSPGVSNPVLSGASISDAVATAVADPFMIQVDGTWHMFFEAVIWRGGSRKGEIALATSDDGRRWTYRQIVLAEPFHLSYPYVFASGSDFYMIPESHQAGSVRLYRATAFPDRWAHVATLMSGPVLVDTSIFEREGRWWLLTETNPEHRHDTLRLFHARHPSGPWTEHPRSPVVDRDPDRARPAGRVLSTAGRLVRFAQVCRPVYGTSVRAFEITRLSTTDYQEREVHESPVLSASGTGWNRSGMHHVDAHPLEDGRWIACVDGWASTRGPRQWLDWVAGRRS